VEYKVVRQKVSGLLAVTIAKQTEEFTRRVNEELRSGWEPVGGVASGSVGTTTHLFQALIKRR
jgi:hypothetical protein